ncbi:MAG: hypothetical protein JW863_19155 [Chitinispirillaceae bacterium]|nr:hypothetical protein [Chitinispirillaceae bacterium]
MSSPFSPADDLEVYCRFCDKITPVQLDRSIAENGRTVDRNSTFEYLCTKCFKTFCYCGNDLIEQSRHEEQGTEAHQYNPQEHFVIGETIHHKKWKESGVVVGKDRGTPSRILVNFEKSGLKKLIEDLQ